MSYKNTHSLPQRQAELVLVAYRAFKELMAVVLGSEDQRVQTVADAQSCAQKLRAVHYFRVGRGFSSGHNLGM